MLPQHPRECISFSNSVLHISNQFDEITIQLYTDISGAEADQGIVIAEASRSLRLEILHPRLAALFPRHMEVLCPGSDLLQSMLVMDTRFIISI